MSSALSVKLGVVDKDFSEGLERNARKFKLFGRELNQGALEMGRTMGMASQSIGKLGAGFQIAGTAAGLFAGADGLAGIAGSLASGGLVLGGMAALTYAMHQFEKGAEDAKSAAEQFNKEIGKLPQNARGLSVLESNMRTLQTALNTKRAELASLAPQTGITDQQAANPIMAGFGALHLSYDYAKNFLKSHALNNDVAQLTTELEAATQAFDDMSNALNTPEAKAKALEEQVRKLAEQTERLNRAARATNDKAILEAWRFTQPNYIGGTVGGIAAQVAVTGMALDNTAYANKLHGNAINPLGFGDLKPELFDPVHELVDGTAHVRLAVESGLKALPDAIGSVLGPIIMGAFGNSRGAQIGGALGGAFGTGVGAYIGASTLGAAVGSAFAPVIGTVIGGAIGSLFGGHKHAIDTNTAAINANTKALEQLTNVPEGYKVNRAAFRAQDAVSIIMDGREVAKAVLNTLRRESQAQYGTTLRIAEVSL